MWKSLVPHPCMVDKNQVGIFVCEDPRYGARGLSPTIGLPTQVSAMRREVPITSGCKNQWGLCLSEMTGSWSPRCSSYRACVRT